LEEVKTIAEKEAHKARTLEIQSNILQAERNSFTSNIEFLKAENARLVAIVGESQTRLEAEMWAAQREQAILRRDRSELQRHLHERNRLSKKLLVKSLEDYMDEEETTG
jgi:predicted ATPase